MEAPDYFHDGYYRTLNQPDIKPGDNFIVEDLLDFSNEDDEIAAFDNTTTGNSTDSSFVTTVHDSCNSSFSCYDPNPSTDLSTFPNSNHFSSDLCVPYDDLAELEWLSNIEEESFSTEDLQKLQLISGMQARNNNQQSKTREFHQPENEIRNNVIFRQEMSVPGKARSKRNRGAPCNWSSRLLGLSPTSSESESDTISGKSVLNSSKLSVSDDNNGGISNSDGRKCLHCATDKTPQWRTGPMGPKTLCNACGVRYKSGRLVPEYRPAASPTFVLTQHSNSHRKVLELRRQKEMQGSVHHHHHHHHHQQQFLHQNPIFDDSSCEDYLIHHHVGSDYRQVI